MLEGIERKSCQSTLNYRHGPGSCLFPEPPADGSASSVWWLHPKLCADQPPPELLDPNTQFPSVGISDKRPIDSAHFYKVLCSFSSM